MKQQILLVDDEPAIRYILNFVLTKFGYSVTEASDGVEAFALIQDAQEEGDPFDLLVTDIQMPRMSGLELIRELKGNDILLPVMVVSGRKDEELIHELQDNGCAGFLMKPFDLQKLEDGVEAVLRQAEKKKRGGQKRLHLKKRGFLDLDRPLSLC